jgi:4-diphosphocytidyl-2-C-methyl-D-erythritol kinase
MCSLTEIVAEPIETWKDRLHNDFEEPIFKTYPEIANIKKILYDAGALYSAMSGSGSAVYGIFKDEVQADHFKIPGIGTEIFVC